MTSALSNVAESAGKRVGYARVSTSDQKLDLQLDALRAAGCGPIFRDQGVSGRDWARPGLTRALRALKHGDQLVVYKLDRLGRSMFEMIGIVIDLDRKGISFCSLTQSFDTKTAIGRGILAFMAAVAEDDLERIRERTKAGIHAARLRGKPIGRPRLLSSDDILNAHREVVEFGIPLDAAARKWNVSHITLARGFRRAGLALVH